MLGDAGDHADQMVRIKFVVSDELADFGQCRLCLPCASGQPLLEIVLDEHEEPAHCVLQAGSEPFILDV
jgi:hypothetical protein